MTKNLIGLPRITENITLALVRALYSENVTLQKLPYKPLHLTWADLNPVDGGYDFPEFMTGIHGFANIFQDYSHGFVRFRSNRDPIKNYYAETLNVNVEDNVIEMKYKAMDRLGRVTDVRKEFPMVDDLDYLQETATNFVRAIIYLN